jgi:uncharacterized Ntn-hydrolase superfamily protein
MRSRSIAALFALLALADPLGATWSIVCVNTRTREVGVGSATCIPDISLRSFVPVIVVGKGAAAAQSAIDTNGENRRLISTRFRLSDDTPAEILAALAANDPEHRGRQYGIVNFTGDPVSFTGSSGLPAARGVTGSVGDFLYAIQGNVLTGNEVVYAAEAAFRESKGDMGQRILAAMEAARALGGDGRCSCGLVMFDGRACGVPPPNFLKSAHVAVVVLARVGDSDGRCHGTHGCAQGDYYLGLNVIHGEADPDPVFTLQKRYDAWRRRLAGRVDGIHSHAEVKGLPADGTSERTVSVWLRDVEDQPILRGGALLEVAPAPGSPALVTVGPVEDRGDGRYTFRVRAGRQAGVARLALRVTDALPSNPLDVVAATLWPYLEVPLAPLGLSAGVAAVSSAAGARVPFTLCWPERAGARYALVAELARPSRGAGQRASGFPLPMGARPFFPAAPLALDELGWANPVLELAPGALTDLVGRRIEVRGLVLDAVARATNRVGLEVLP